MIKNIVLDMGNVLLDYNPTIPLDLFFETDEDKAIILNELFNGPEWIKGDLGEIKNEERYDGVSKRVPKRLHDRLKQCVDGWTVCMTPIKGAKEFVQYVKDQGYKIYVLSNACNAFYDYFPNFHKLDYFDGIVVSSDIHMIKPDARIYECFLDKYDLTANECLFIDDRKDNIEGAMRMGMKGHIFRNDFDQIQTIYKL